MPLRRGHAVVAAAASSLCLVATAALATPALARDVTSEEIAGTVVSIDTRSNRFVLADGRVVRYDRNDIINVQHYHDFYEEVDPGTDEEPGIGCDLWDTGGEGLVTDYLARRLPVTVTGLEFSRVREVSGFIFSVDTCDGVVDGDDET